MTSAVEYFGPHAGTVWSALHVHGPLTIAAIKRKTKLTDREVYAALGWLAREGKITIQGTQPLHYKFALLEAV